MKTTPRRRKTYGKFPPPPRMLVMLLDLVEMREVEMEDLRDIVAQDQNVADKLIEVSNSSFFFRREPVRRLDQAVMALGLDMSIALSAVEVNNRLYRSFAQHYWHAIHRSWRNALWTACLARALASVEGYPRPFEAFIAGLVMDVGRLGRLTVYDEAYAVLLQTTNSVDELFRAEKIEHGGTHCDETAGLLKSWGFNAHIVEAARNLYVRESGSSAWHPLVSIINRAHRLILTGWGSGNAEDSDRPSKSKDANADPIAKELDPDLEAALRDRIAEDIQILLQPLFQPNENTGRGEPVPDSGY